MFKSQIIYPFVVVIYNCEDGSFSELEILLKIEF